LQIHRLLDLLYCEVLLSNKMSLTLHAAKLLIIKLLKKTANDT